jgi:hypothetical protein
MCHYELDEREIPKTVNIKAKYVDVHALNTDPSSATETSTPHAISIEQLYEQTPIAQAIPTEKDIVYWVTFANGNKCH